MRRVTCLALELRAPAGYGGECTGFPSHEETDQLQVHVDSNVQEGTLPGEGVFVKVGEKAADEKTHVTLRLDRGEWQSAQGSCSAEE